MKNNRKKNNHKISKIISITYLISIVLLFVLIFIFNVINIFIEIGAFVLFLVLFFFINRLNHKKKKILRFIGNIISTIFIVVNLFVSIYLLKTEVFLMNSTNGNYYVSNYNVVVLKESKITEIKELNDKTVGITKTIEDSKLTKLKKKLNKKIDVKYEESNDINELISSLVENKVEAIILENSEMALLEEENYDNFALLKKIYKVKVRESIKDLVSSVNINKEPFNILISGIDTYGEVNSNSRSDVNILISVNPKTEKILITWVPRDYYVNINDSSYKDKLTHAGIYGIDNSVYAISHLLDVDVNYYVKVNFTSLVNIVEAFGGVDVYNDQTFTTTLDYKTFKEGNVHLNGEDALSFVRERKHLSGGDTARGKNQIKVLTALIMKAKSKDTIKNYGKILSSLNGSFVTNMPQNNMISFAKKELRSKRDWNIESNTLSGTNGSEYTYSYKKNKLYVMIPNEDSVNEAKEKIQETFNEN